MLDVVGPESLTVIANTGDDIEIYGGYVSPDPDLITFWLADQIDSRGWGLDGDTFNVMDGLRGLGQKIWFNLGDRDLAIALDRAAALTRGERLTTTLVNLAISLGVKARVLPMSDQPVRTRVSAAGRWWPLQEFLIQGREIAEVDDVDFRGAAAAQPTPEVLDAIAKADVIVIGPSNPVISIGPIFAIPGLRDAIKAASAPVVAVSPIVGGSILKGPTAAFMRAKGVSVSASGLKTLYAGLIDGLVADEPGDSVPTLQADLLMKGSDDRRRLASEALAFGTALGASPSN
jgi:LPPG:FO 2-phospho-L-lactate transferase